MDVEALVGPVVESAGLDLWDVRFGRESGRRVLRVFVDREGGVDLDAIAGISEKISRRLDLEGFAPGPYELEVSSPGLERQLRTPRHFRATVGERVRVRTSAPIDGARSHEGVLAEADDAGLRIDTAEGAVRIPYEAVTSARTVMEWGAPATRAGKQRKRSNA